MTNEAILVTQQDAAQMFGVHRNTIGDLVKFWGIETKPMSNGKAKGLNRSDLKVIARALNGARVRVTAA